MSSQPVRLRILLADDGPEIARRVSDLLREGGNVDIVGPFSDGDSALERLRQTSPDGAVLDVNMPGRSGIDVLRAAREAGYQGFVVMMTSDADPSIRQACLDAGADHFLSKSSELDRLVEIIQPYVHRRPG